MVDDDAPYALVVDDVALIRLDVVDILENAGFRTFEASAVDAAIDALGKHADDIQLLFSDVQMPGSNDGFHLSRVCNERWPHVAILIASGRLTPSPGELPEAACFIGKPFSPDVVYDRLQKLLPDGACPLHWLPEFDQTTDQLTAAQP
jgi:CheY-like chemotaxis protein